MSSANTRVYRTDIQDSATAEKRATREVQETVIKRFHPDLDLSTKGDDFVAGTFDAIMWELERKSQARPPNARADSIGSRTITKLSLIGSRIIKVPHDAVSKGRGQSRQDGADDLPEFLKPLATSKDRP